MRFSVSTRVLGDVTAVDVRGRLTLPEGEALHDLLLDLFREGRKKVLLNFHDLSYLDSSGVGQLVRALFAAHKFGAELCAVDLNTRAQEILRLANLHTVLSDYPDESSALGSFSAH